MNSRDDTFPPSDPSVAAAEVASLRAELDAARRALAERDEAIQARDDFLAIAAHELRNPLHTLTLQLTVLQRMAALGDAEAVGRHAERAVRSARHFSRRASVLLDIGRVNRGMFHLDLGSMSVTALVDEVVERYREDAEFQGVALTRDVPVDVVVRWDRQAMDQALSNLVGNAIKYGEGRPVDVRVRAVDPSRVRIAVADGGPGISASDRERVFARFERLLRDRPRAEGFGLGLWLTRRIVVAHGGTIHIDSVAGHGSAFIMTLPVVPAIHPPPSPADRDHDPS